MADDLRVIMVDDEEPAAVLAGQEFLSQGFQARHAHPFVAPVPPGAVGVQLLGRHRRYPPDDVRCDALVGIDATVLFVPIDTGDGERVVVVYADLGGDVGDGHFPFGGGVSVFAMYLLCREPRDQC